jgi:hypothetical protein
MERPKLVCVLGAPMSGHKPHCMNLVRDFKYKYLSVGDLFR